MSALAVEKLEYLTPERCDVLAIGELLLEIECLLGCGNTCATSLYDRLKVVRRATRDLVARDADGRA